MSVIIWVDGAEEIRRDPRVRTGVKTGKKVGAYAVEGVIGMGVESLLGWVAVGATFAGAAALILVLVFGGAAERVREWEYGDNEE